MVDEISLSLMPIMIDERISRKVLTVGPEYDPPKGGLAKVIHSYSKLFPRFRFIMTYRPGSNPLSQLLRLGWDWLKFFNICIFGGIKIVHIHCCSNNSFWRKSIFVTTGRVFRKKIVLHIHGGGFDTFSRAHRKAVEHVLRKVDILITLSSYWKHFFEENFHPKKIIVVPNIVDEPLFMGTRSENAEGVFLGNLNEPKGIFDLLDVIAEYRDELKGKFTLHIGGNGEIERLMNIVKQNGLEDIVFYDGWVDGEKKARLMTEANIFILPSYVEGLPISILEAMTYGMAVVSTHVGGIPEIVHDGENGFLIAPGDKKALHDALIHLIDDGSLRSEMGQRSSKMVQLFLPANVELCLTEIYSELLKN